MSERATTDSAILTSKLRKLAAQLPYFSQALKLVWTAAPRHAITWAVLLVVQGLLPIATVYLVRALVNGLVDAIRGPTNPTAARELLFLIGLTAIVLALSEATRVAAAWVRTAKAELVQDHITRLIHSQSLSVDLAFYDNADFYDHLYRARSEASYRPVALLENLGAIFQYGITLVSMAVVLLSFGAWPAFALVLSTVPALYVVLRHALDEYAWRLRVTPDERRAWYYDWMLSCVEAAAELRLFQLGEHFQARFDAVRSRLRAERLQLAREKGRADLLAGLATLAIAGSALAWVVWKALQKRATLGDVALFYQALQQGLGLCRSLLDNVGQLYANTLFLGNLFEFLGLESKVVCPPRPRPVVPPRQSIRFRQATFHYPSTSRAALRGLDLEIPAGKITAVVGANGAGKTTLIKLLCRLYDPDDGSVELDGVDLRALDLEKLRSSITVLFQRPMHYNATARENINVGDVTGNGEEARIRAAAEAAGADVIIGKLPLGYDQVLGRWFENGTELSEGEWQRIALARAFLRCAPILILDEPTSAMDPWTEVQWLRRFRALANGRTVLVITHRLTTAIAADTIHVISEGQVVESGSHEQLLRAGGAYARGWEAAARVISREATAERL